MWPDRFTICLSALFLAGSAFALLFWFPNDIETGVIETFRRRTTVGDAMAPTVVMVGILISSILMGVSSIFEGRSGNNNGDLELDKTKFSTKVTGKCEREWVALEINELLVVEYYSRKV